MADQNPTGAGPINLDLPEPHVKILRRTLTMSMWGLEDDLRAPGRLSDPARASQEADAFERLLMGLDRGEMVVPDAVAREVVQAMATSADAENNYAEVVAEHAALYGLLACLDSGGHEHE